MDPPSDIRLPFFAYGLFRPGQLGFLRLKRFVQGLEDCVVRGKLIERDGLPLFDSSCPQEQYVEGTLIHFRQILATEAYQSIAELEPDKQYRWDVVQIPLTNGPSPANILHGQAPAKGSVPLEAYDWNGKPDLLFRWDGRDDALLTVALEVVRDVFNENQNFAWDLKPLFRLQMAYLLLWSAIERYASLRYHLGVNVTKKVRHLADEPAFETALQQFVKQGKSVYRADQPKERYRLDPTDPRESLDFYYQIRSNIIHRGKAVPDDFDLLKDSLWQLYQIFDCVLESAFAEAKVSNTS